MNKNKQKIVNRRKKKEEGRKRLYYVPMKVYNNTLLENFCAQQTLYFYIQLFVYILNIYIYK